MTDAVIRIKLVGAPVGSKYCEECVKQSLGAWECQIFGVCEHIEVGPGPYEQVRHTDCVAAEVCPHCGKTFQEELPQ